MKEVVIVISSWSWSRSAVYIAVVRRYSIRVMRLFVKVVDLLIYEMEFRPTLLALLRCFPTVGESGFSFAVSTTPNLEE